MVRLESNSKSGRTRSIFGISVQVRIYPCLTLVFGFNCMIPSSMMLRGGKCFYCIPGLKTSPITYDFVSFHFTPARYSEIRAPTFPSSLNILTHLKDRSLRYSPLLWLHTKRRHLSCLPMPHNK
jgi:hypothetical protein